MNINVNGGHCTAAPGASGLLDELTEDRRIKDALIAELQARGHEVSDGSSDASSVNGDLQYQASVANNSGADLGVSIHLNAGGGTGTEVWYYADNDEGAGYAAAVSAALASYLGIADRGPKGTTGLYWLNHTKATAVLVEVCFVDNQTDADAYGAHTVEGIASAIADGILGTSTSSAPAATDTPAATSTTVDVDGWWGTQTTTALQRIHGTTQDGIVSGQVVANNQWIPRAGSGWDWGSGTGSQLIMAMQTRVGATPDGIWGHDTSVAWQAFLGVTQDGYFGPGSVTALQTWINQQ